MRNTPLVLSTAHEKTAEKPMKSGSLNRALTGHATPTNTEPCEVFEFRTCCNGNSHYQRLLILCLASAIERDSAKLMAWFHDDRIAQLNNRTAEELVSAGLTEDLEKFLLAVAEADRA